MNSIALTFLLSLVTVSSVGVLLAIKNLRSAPEGFEDDAGFHYGRFAQETMSADGHQVLAEVHAERHAA